MRTKVYLILIIFPSFLFAQDKNIYVLENGNIGIGTPSPSKSLEVQGDTKINRDVKIEKIIQVNGDLNSSETIKADGNDLLPIGSIVMWTSKFLPNDNWKICDGQNGRPNLTDCFVVGVGIRDDNPAPDLNSYKEAFNFKTSGGFKNISLESKQIPSHTHQVALTDYDRSWNNAWGYANKLDVISKESITYYSDNDGSGYNIDQMEGKPMNNLPPYYMVYFIVKVK